MLGRSYPQLSGGRFWHSWRYLWRATGKHSTLGEHCAKRFSDSRIACGLRPAYTARLDENRGSMVRVTGVVNYLPVVSVVRCYAAANVNFPAGVSVVSCYGAANVNFLVGVSVVRC
jgi:hypothetical protein